MKTRHYKTLAGFFKAFNLRQFTLNDYGYGCLYHPSLHETVRFVFTPELQREICHKFAEGFCSSKSAINKYADIILWGFNRKPIFSRVWIARGSSGKFYGEYCAGQDYIAEVRHVQKLLRDF